MKTLTLFLFILITALSAEPPATAAKSSVVHPAPKRPLWVPTDEKAAADFALLISSTEWKFDHPDTKNAPLKLRANGGCESRTWKGLWKQTGPREIILTISGGRTSVLEFDPEVNTYSGKHFDGAQVNGRRSGQVPSSAAKR